MREKKFESRVKKREETHTASPTLASCHSLACLVRASCHHLSARTPFSFVSTPTHCRVRGYFFSFRNILSEAFLLFYFIIIFQEICIVRIKKTVCCIGFLCGEAFKFVDLERVVKMKLQINFSFTLQYGFGTLDEVPIIFA